MWGILCRTMVKVGLVKPCGLVRPVSVSRMAGRYLAHQEGLPRLPVPPLHQTCERYLAALAPIVEEEHLQRARELLRDFQKPGGVGEELQRGLEMRARKTENWLSDWWVQVAYLDYRLPVVIHSNPGLVLPRVDVRDKQGQLRYAAKLIAGVLDFKAMIDNETLPVEYLGGNPLCMNQYYQILSSCRLPGMKRDSVVNHARTSTHIAVVHNLQFFVLDVYNSDGTALTPDQLCAQLEKILEWSLLASVEPVGILTSQHRNAWGQAYLNLVKDETNSASMRAIQESIFTVCLDKAMPPVVGDMYHTRAAVQMLHGGGSSCNSGNRWFDKTLQFIIGEDGSCGLIYEHAPAEGPPIVALVDHIVEYTNRKTPEPVSSPKRSLLPPRKLSFNITPDIKEDIEEAKHNLDTMVQDVDVKVMVFDHFGKNIPKAFKMSPDAFIQIALQLAYYRMYQRCVSTYESASLRMYRLGRTDTIRSVSIDSANFVKAFDDPSKQNTEKLSLMDKAVQSHKLYTNMAIRGQAIDRHLLGLKMQALEEQISIPKIFQDHSYTVAMHYKLSTSQVPSKSDCVMCFGPVVPDGYGVCYNPMETHINIAMSAFNSCKETNVAHLALAMENALLDMRMLLEKTPKAKL